MSWAIMQPGKAPGGNTLAEGECALLRGGNLVVRRAELEEAGITDFAVVMFDKDNFRVALRAARADETEQRVQVCRDRRRSKDSDRRSINVRRAILAMDLEPRAIAGRYELLVKGDCGAKDALLIVPLISTKTPGEKAAKE